MLPRKILNIKHQMAPSGDTVKSGVYFLSFWFKIGLFFCCYSTVLLYLDVAWYLQPQAQAPVAAVTWPWALLTIIKSEKGQGQVTAAAGACGTSTGVILSIWYIFD